VGELLNGSPAHRRITAYEVAEWGYLYKIEAEEHAKEMARAKRGRGRR
jgi:hypothetical protein